jgi:surface polysaccharide O-acyltransferase-like enzyme
MRNATLDYGRMVAALGIVLFHCGGPGALIGYSGLPFFTMVLILLALPVADRQSFARFARGRAVRLLRPWLIWSVFYGALKLAEVLATGRSLSSEFTLSMLLTGPAIHLWFLPFAFVACLALYPLARLWPGGDAPVLVPQVGLALVALALFWGGQSGVLEKWVFVLPSVFLGLAFALARGDRGRLLTAVGLSLAVLGVAWLQGWTLGVAQQGLATAALVLCLVVRLPETPVSMLCATLSLGVYLSQRLVASVVERLTPLDLGTPGFALATILGSVVLALGLHLAGQALSRSRTGAHPA